VTDGYSKLSEDMDFRKECADKVGLAFAIPSSILEVVPITPKSGGLAHSEQALVKQG
jgi:hypothetical protein